VAAKDDNDPPPIFYDQCIHYLTPAKTAAYGENDKDGCQ
jgi:hypothetical protein